MDGALIIGSSHALQFASAVGHYPATWQEASQALIPIEAASGRPAHLLFATSRPSFLELVTGPDGQPAARFGTLMESVRAYDRPDAKVILNIGGNEHNIGFLCAQPRPFDFAHPSHPGLLPGRQVIPRKEVAAALNRMMLRMQAVTRLIAAELPRAQRYYLPPPPPIPSEAQIRTNPAIFDFDAHGIEDAGVRLKIYSLYLEIMARFCGANGLTFLAPPAANRDALGFLAESYWAGSTHASPAYYASVVAELGL